jgi:hypothetical protein
MVNAIIMKNLYLTLFFLVCCSQNGFCREIEIGLATLSIQGNIPSSQQIHDFEKHLGRKIDTLNWFLGFNGDTKELPPFPLDDLKKNVPPYIVPMLTWEPWANTKDAQGHVIDPFLKINNGELDPYIRSFAIGMKSFCHPIRLRFAHEMIQGDNPMGTFPNPKWYPWQDWPESFKKAWIRIYAIFKSEHADNVEFVWSPNFEPYYSDVLKKYYPGKMYVDWIGIDGYNWGGGDFDSVFKNMYTVLTGSPEIYGDKPIMLGEIGAAAQPGNTKSFDKSAWISDAFRKIKTDYPRIKSFYWFEVKKERDWRLNESPETWNAFKKAINDTLR